MTKAQLYGTVLALALIALAWTYFDYRAASAEADFAAQKVAESNEQLRVIKLLRTKTGEAVRIVPSDFDIYPVITKCISAAGVSLPSSYPIQPSRLKLVEGTGVRKWQVRLPPLTGTVSQIDKLVRILLQSDFACQVRSIKMTASEPDSVSEKWKFELEIVYLRSDDET